MALLICAVRISLRRIPRGGPALGSPTPIQPRRRALFILWYAWRSRVEPHPPAPQPQPRGPFARRDRQLVFGQVAEGRDAPLFNVQKPELASLSDGFAHRGLRDASQGRDIADWQRASPVFHRLGKAGGKTPNAAQRWRLSVLGTEVALHAAE